VQARKLINQPHSIISSLNQPHGIKDRVQTKRTGGRDNRGCRQAGRQFHILGAHLSPAKTERGKCMSYHISLLITPLRWCAKSTAAQRTTSRGDHVFAHSGHFVPGLMQGTSCILCHEMSSHNSAQKFRWMSLSRKPTQTCRLVNMQKSLIKLHK
jgi:hypothetical protein